MLLQIKDAICYQQHIITLVQYTSQNTASMLLCSMCQAYMLEMSLSDPSDDPRRK